ncbi:hypothetical protein PR202_ga11390 [Eleusine coracana subsp. coracana]|uniref:Xylanase inhibitor C-terminal domain-containing protein n=1 Tax=Eleusine coracana subsp. coracana TaxID=191504 RepID=A0AAV5C8V3_ELECO|nr:hypothetical protein PR202_ga11390 [Eleusine coracana subsp. coracana]
MVLVVVLVVVVAASLDDGGRVEAWDVEGQLVDGAETLLIKAFGKLKISQKFKDALEGFKAGRKGYKTGKKLYNLMVQHIPEDVITSVFIAGYDPMPIPVAGVDITTRTVAQIGGRCAATGTGLIGVPSRQTLIGLYGRQSKPIVSLASATFLQCPAAGGARWAVLGLGELARRGITFSYLVVREPGGFVNTLALFGPQLAHLPGRRSSTPLVLNLQDPSSARYRVKITGILVDGLDIMAQDEAPLNNGIWRQDFNNGGGVDAYLSTTEPYSFLELGLYRLLRGTIEGNLLQAHRILPESAPPDGPLCYKPSSAVPFPSIAVKFAGGGVMPLNVANVLVSDPDGYDCLSIRPATTSYGDSILGAMLQSATLMTIQPPAAGHEGTLWF